MDKKIISLPSNANAIQDVEHFVDEVCVSFTIGEEVYGNILIAITEAANNAIIHGNKRDDSKKIQITASKHKNAVTFEVADEGQGFDYENLPDPTAPENLTSLGGRGVFLIKQLADEVEFQNNGQTVSISFNIPS